jgi:hypothetical protein
MLAAAVRLIAVSSAITTSVSCRCWPVRSLLRVPSLVLTVKHSPFHARIELWRGRGNPRRRACTNQKTQALTSLGDKRTKACQVLIRVVHTLAHLPPPLTTSIFTSNSITPGTKQSLGPDKRRLRLRFLQEDGRWIRVALPNSG